MSQMGQKQTYRFQFVMSAPPPESRNLSVTCARLLWANKRHFAPRKNSAPFRRRTNVNHPHLRRDQERERPMHRLQPEIIGVNIR
jgi:hypothetical protein